MSAQSNTRTARKPPPGRPFKKGQSGNPGGRPKGLYALLDSIVSEQDWKRIVEVQKVIAMCDGEMCAQLGLEIPTTKEVTEAAKFLTERRFGKAAQSMELTGENGGPILTRIERVIIDSQGEPA